MHSRLYTLAAGMAVALSLFGVVSFAQASSLNATQVSAIVGLLQAFGADQSIIANVQANLLGQSTVASTMSCASFSTLKRGDTDATSGGAVTQLQRYVGISPTTGYYGALTQIAYGNKCINNNAQPGAVAGMSKYTDSDFGFSFWYPNGWTVIKHKSGSGSFSPWEITITNPQNTTQNLAILETTSDSAVNNIEGYYFDSRLSTWMQQESNTPPQAADISNNTMGGLHVFPGNEQSIIPLSANKFLSVSANDVTNTVQWGQLANTIVATDSSVATPVSTAQQIAAIQAEASAYGVSGAVTPITTTTQTYSNSQYGFSVQYPSTAIVNPDCSEGFAVCRNNPAVVFSVQSSQQNSGFDHGFTSISVVTGSAAAAACVVNTSPGYGTFSNKTINNIPFAVYGTGSIAAGTQEGESLYNTLHNGNCYVIDQDEFSHIGQSSTQAQADLESIAQSFRFTN